LTYPTLDELVALALAEDLGERGDVTSAATVDEDAMARARVVAREPGVLAGLDAAQAVFAHLGAKLTPEAGAGDHFALGQTLAVAEGSARSLLAAERTALNLLGHLCGVATVTARYVEAVGGTACQVRDTRKTMPGLRALQKAAVAAGGGVNHRSGLDDGLLVKDNHVTAAGGVAEATRRALANDHGLPVQIEVDTLDQLDQALAAGARSVLLDNFGLDDMVEAVGRCRQHGETVFVEASGGVTLDTVAAIAGTGVDAVAVGALTHSVPALDVGLDF
jgi:nicotinate-nucleotide pyrophosphorylase (carboxylating)